MVEILDYNFGRGGPPVVSVEKPSKLCFNCFYLFRHFRKSLTFYNLSVNLTLLRLYKNENKKIVQATQTLVFIVQQMRSPPYTF